jgi:hypothetical protein
VTTRRRLIASGTLAAIGALALASWRLTAAPAPPQFATANPARVIPAEQQRPKAAGDKGATYYWLESLTTRVTTRFADATVVAERGPDGDLTATVTATGGVTVARFKVDRVDGAADVLQYAPQSGERLQALSGPGVRPTLAWANNQAYSLWKDNITSLAALEWQGSLMRPAGAAKHDLEQRIVELKTEWAGGLEASAKRVADVAFPAFPNRVLRGEVLVNRLVKDGVQVGSTSWFPKDQIYFWDLAGVSRGYADSVRLKEYGGWTFTPDAEWINLQSIAFQHFKTTIDLKGFVARDQAPSWPERVANLLMPTVLANQPGCDGLHWLDGTVLRYCCDVHDLCYEKYGCTSRSWWRFSGWSCTSCNMRAVFCFSGGGDGPFYQYP